MRHLMRIAVLLAILPLSALSSWAAPAASIPMCYSSGRCDCVPDQACFFPEKNTTMDPVFSAYWTRYDGLRNFGLAIANANEQVIEGKTYKVQYFERHRLELHTEEPASSVYRIQLGLMGEKYLASKGRDWKTEFPRAPGPMADCLYKSTSNGDISQNICQPYLRFWAARGIPAPTDTGSTYLYGLPISGVVRESIGGESYDVQWFERARFEYHPTEKNPDYHVLFGLLVKEMYEKKALISLALTSLPASEEGAYEELAQAHGLTLKGFSRDNMALTGVSGGRPTLLFTPVAEWPILDPKEIFNQPALLQGLALGGLTVLRDLPDLPAGRYLIGLGEGGAEMLLYGRQSREPIRIAAVIRDLPVALDQPLALVSSSQICLLSQHTSICGFTPAPPAESDLAQIGRAADQLGISPRDIDPQQTVAIVAGQAQLERCSSGLLAPETRIDDCSPNVLAAPAVDDNTISPRVDGVGPALGIIFVSPQAGEAIREEVYSKPERDVKGEIAAGDLPAGSYAVFAMPGPADPSRGDTPRSTWVALVGRAGVFYMPAIAGASFVGVAANPELRGIPRPRAAVTSSLILRDVCFFKVAECAWQP